MAKLRVLSRAFEQPQVTERDDSGFPVSFHPTKQVWAPALYKYCGFFVVKEDRERTAWTLCLVDDGALIHPDSLNDPDVRSLPQNLALDTVLSGARLTAAQNWIDRTDWAITIAGGSTVKDVLLQIQAAIRSGDIDTR